MEHKKIKFIVCAPSYDENSGGVIALHKLCDLLNINGESAFIFPYYHPLISTKKIISIKQISLFIIRYIKFFIKKRLKVYKTNNNLNTPIIKYKNIDKESDIVIYPEIVSGNPLEVKNIVRWLLHKPGFHTGEVHYGKNDIFFFYQIIFNDLKLNQFEDHLLTVLWVRDDIYKQTNFNKRQGTCCMIRKGKDRKLFHDIENSILLDGMSHDEIAKIMNECEYFISYDTETMYSQYAVLCGCKSIVIPKEGVRKDEWQPKKELQYGIAYGFDDIKEAEKTKHLVHGILKKLESESNKSVIKFIKKMYLFKGLNYG